MKKKSCLLFLLVLILVISSTTCFAWQQKWDENKKRWSSLMRATYNGNHNRIIRLMNKGCDINYKSPSGVDAFEISIRKQDSIAFMLFIESGKLTINDSLRYLILACQGKDTKMVKVLLNNGFDTGLYDSSYTPLEAAVLFGTIEIVQIIINNGANVNYQRKNDGITPLMLAVYSGSFEKVKLLVEHGANTTSKSNSGKLPIDFLDCIKDPVDENAIVKIRALLTR